MAKVISRRPPMPSNPSPDEAERWRREQEERARAAYAALGPLQADDIAYLLRIPSESRRRRTLANWYGAWGARIAAVEFARMTQGAV